MVSRSENLKEILEIEDEINKLEINLNYRTIKENLKKLEKGYFGLFISVPSPNNLKETIKIKRNSPQLENTIKLYKEKIEDYQNRIYKLKIKRKDLKNALFQ
ncbi:hypothetical protein JW865_04780 [Candidatus Bathyarchaeota archaeon]|nr:hypothetical protein [Candidatus Bathyarchaeota archaeon]